MAGGDGGEQVAYVVDTNLGGTLGLLELARTCGARFLFISTSRVYPLESLRAIELDEAPSRLEIAEAQTLPGISQRGISEAFPLEGARTLYGATK